MEPFSFIPSLLFSSLLRDREGEIKFSQLAEGMLPVECLRGTINYDFELGWRSHREFARFWKYFQDVGCNVMVVSLVGGPFLPFLEFLPETAPQSSNGGVVSSGVVALHFFWVISSWQWRTSKHRI